MSSEIMHVSGNILMRFRFSPEYQTLNVQNPLNHATSHADLWGHCPLVNIPSCKIPIEIVVVIALVA